MRTWRRSGSQSFRGSFQGQSFGSSFVTLSPSLRLSYTQGLRFAHPIRSRSPTSYDEGPSLARSRSPIDPWRPRLFFFHLHVSFCSSNTLVVRRCVGSTCSSTSHRSFFLCFVSFSSHPLDRRVSTVYFFFFRFSLVRLTLTYPFLLAWRVTAALAGHCARACRACWLLPLWFPRATRGVPIAACMLTFGRCLVVRIRSNRRYVASPSHPVFLRWC